MQKLFCRMWPLFGIIVVPYTKTIIMIPLLINLLLVMTHTLQPLPYALDALAPYMSAETLEYHHGKHQQAYVNNLNNLVQGTPYSGSTLEEIILKAEGPIYNNAAQDWNHTFFFQALSPTPKVVPGEGLLKAITRDFGSFEAFKEQFSKVGASLFGSGWVFLAVDKAGKLSIVAEPNAGNPLRAGLTPLLAMDVWEHAYYIDYRNARPQFITAFWSVLDWGKVEERYKF